MSYAFNKTRNGFKSPVRDVEALTLLPHSFSSNGSCGKEMENRSLREKLGVALLVVGWYSTAIGCITTSKKTLLFFPYPFLLSFTQFLVSLVVSWLRSYVLSREQAQRYPQTEKKSTLRRLATAIGVAYTAGFIFTNISFGLVSANFAETVKAGEPISSVVLGTLVLGQSYSLRSCVYVSIICFGVGLSCVGDDAFNIFGFLFAAASNFCFSYRAVLAKKLHNMFPGEIDEFTLFQYIATIGCMATLPLTVIFEWGDIYSNWILSDAFMSQSFYLPFLLFINGSAYCAYNVLSFYVLYRTDVIVHAVFNVCRRMVIIMFTAHYFAVHIGLTNAVGIGIALLGVLMFSLNS